MPRGNKTIWRVARWLWQHYPEEEGFGVPFEEVTGELFKYRYDTAAELMKKIQLNEFTGEDQHDD